MAFWNRHPRHSPALLASAARIEVGRRNDESAAAPYKDWQDEAWDAYDDIGEFRQGVKWLSNVLSRARLVAAVAPANPGDEPQPIDPDTNDPAVGLVAEIGHGIGGQSDLLRSATVHLTVPGEGWFVGAVNADDPDLAAEMSWKFYSRDEIRQSRTGGGTEVQIAENRWVALPEESLPVRVWRPHDRYHWQADSSTRAALPILHRLQLLNRKLDAQIQSRLASNGMLVVASEADFPAPEGMPEGDDPFTYEFMQHGITAIKTPGSAAAAMPYVAKMSMEVIKDGLLYLDFAKLEGGPELLADREFEIRRLATAMDVPPEVLLGMAGMNHWGALQVEESALKTTVASLLELICWSFTTGYLRPALRAMGDIRRSMPVDQDVEEIPPDAERIVWYDLSELEVRPDHSQDVIALHGSLDVTDSALTRETGLSEEDLLVDVDELKRRIGRKLAIMSPGTVELGLELLNISHLAKIDLGQNAEAGAPDAPEPTAGEGDMPAGMPAPAPPTNGDTPVPPEPALPSA